MALATRHRNDPAPVLDPLPGLRVHRETRAERMALLQSRPVEAMAARLAAGHRAYVASLGGEPAAWGWAATRTAEIGELASAFAVPPGERYLWNFVTLAPHRGRGIYPRLVDAIVAAESAHAERFWIAHAPENHASAAGIRKAGFAPVAELSFGADGRAAVRGLAPGGGALAARLLGLAVAEAVAPCWRCARSASGGGGSCRPGACSCDYQRPHAGCAA